mgnify:CR=1 FL=1
MSSNNTYSFPPNQNIQFTANATGGVSPYSYSWNFGDGTSGSGNPVTHSYSAEATYTVTVTVTDSIGETASASVYIVIAVSSLALDVSGTKTYNGNYYAVEGSTLTLTATLSWSGYALSGQTIDFYVNGTQVGSATTDSNGDASYQYTVNTTGTLQIYATYSGYDGYSSAKSETYTVYAVAPLSVSVGVS